MPYYKDYFVNSWHPSHRAPDVGGFTDFPVARDTSVVTGFRARPHENSVKSERISDISMDPYAYFLSSTSKRKYQAALKQRGLKPQGQPDRGHPFELIRHTLKGQLHDFTILQPGSSDPVRNYVGAMVFSQPSAGNSLNHVHEGTILKTAPYKESDLGAFAQQAFLRSAPTAAIFNAGEFLGELLEGLPHLSVNAIKSVTDGMRATGSGYLNAEFGWKPFISSLQDAGRALFHTTRMLSQQGKRVHRKLEQPPITFADSVTYDRTLSYQIGEWGLVPVDSPWGIPRSTGANYGTARVDYLKSRTTTRWFEGEFTSFLPLTFDPKSYTDRLAALMDVRITPATLWELAPWSWLVDWQLHIGSSIAAAQLAADDKLIMHYGYAMETVVYETICSWKRLTIPTSGVSSPNFPKHGQLNATTTYKRRLRANPYGFRTGGTGALTGNQLNILGALGLTKAK